MLTKVRITNLERAARTREETEGRVVGVIVQAGNRGATLIDVAEGAGISAKSAYKYLADLHDDERIHIGLWRIEGDRTKAAYVPGAGEDAKRPSIDDVREGRLEDDILTEKWEQHRHWAAEWKPQRDPVAAWF